MRLYDIAQEYTQLLRMVDDGELTAEMVADTLESINIVSILNFGIYKPD